MTSAYSIAHISDLHLSAEFHRHNIRHVKLLLEYIERRGADHLVITGDIASNARPEDFELARSLLSSYGFLDSRRTTIIPGNHDIFGGVHTPEDILAFPSRCRKTDVPASLAVFAEWFGELFNGCYFSGEGVSYPFVKVVGPVTLLGMNSVASYSVLRNPIGSNGMIPRADIERATILLSRHALPEGPRIALIHHHFHNANASNAGGLGRLWANLEQQTMKLWEKNRLFKFFARENIDIVLHGHVHVNLAYVRNNIRFASAGGSVMGPESRPPSVDFITLRGTEITTDFLQVPAEPHFRPAKVVTPVFPVAIARWRRPSLGISGLTAHERH